MSERGGIGVVDFPSIQGSQARGVQAESRRLQVGDVGLGKARALGGSAVSLQPAEEGEKRRLAGNGEPFLQDRNLLQIEEW